MTTTIGIARDLAGILVPIGLAGAALAILCAIVAGVAIARGASGLSGGAVGVWIPFALLSMAASFSNQWLPTITAVAALVVMLVLGGLVRGAVALVRSGALARPERVAEVAVDAAPATTTIVVPVRSAPMTGAIAVVS